MPKRFNGVVNLDVRDSVNVQHFRRDLYAALAARDPKPSIVLIDASRRYLFEFTAHQIVRDMVADHPRPGLRDLDRTSARRGRRGNQPLYLCHRTSRGSAVSNHFRCD
jgi:hypothetical protein